MHSGRSIDHIVLAVDDLDRAAATYESLGFTLTPRASHNDAMGTSNRLVQLQEGNYIELLEVDRPRTLQEHALDADPPRFSFGAHNREFVSRRTGVSMIVFASKDATSDLNAFTRAGLQTYERLDFDRQAVQPDGSKVTLAFSLGFVTSAHMPDLAFVVCQHHAPEYFWKPEYQQHENGAAGIAAVYLAAQTPADCADFFQQLFGGEITAIEDGVRVACGGQDLMVLTPERIQKLDPDAAVPSGSGPVVSGIALRSGGADASVIATEKGCGLFIEWR